MSEMQESAMLTAAMLSSAMLQSLVDRIEIQELFTRYYTDLDGVNPEAFGNYFVADAEFDVNGMVVRGQQAIADVYRRVAADKPPRTGTFRMLLSNLQIQVTGTTATARCLWTQLLNDSLKGTPQLIEQGREFDALVKRDGQWRITKRVVIADSGLPDMFDKTYKARANYKLP